MTMKYNEPLGYAVAVLQFIDENNREVYSLTPFVEEWDFARNLLVEYSAEGEICYIVQVVPVHSAFEPAGAATPVTFGKTYPLAEGA